MGIGGLISVNWAYKSDSYAQFFTFVGASAVIDSLLFILLYFFTVSQRLTMVPWTLIVSFCSFCKSAAKRCQMRVSLSFFFFHNLQGNDKGSSIFPALFDCIVYGYRSCGKIFQCTKFWCCCGTH
jgi:hypothetical protein